MIPNSDGAGIVDKVGPMVPERWVGKRVWLYNGQRNGRWMGTAAEYISLNADLVTELPSHVSFAEGATLGIPGMTAHGCVFAAGAAAGQDRAGDRRRRRGRPLRRATRRMGGCFGDRDGQLGRKSREGASRRRRVRHQLPHRGCRGAGPRHHRRRVGRPRGRCRSRRQSGRDAGLGPGRRQHRVLRVETERSNRRCRCAR